MHAFVALGIAVPAVGQDGSYTMPPALVEVATAELQEMAPSVDVSGAVVSLNDSRIASEIEGVLTWLADVGDAVDALPDRHALFRVLTLDAPHASGFTRALN